MESWPRRVPHDRPVGFQYLPNQACREDPSRLHEVVNAAEQLQLTSIVFYNDEGYFARLRMARNTLQRSIVRYCRLSRLA